MRISALVTHKHKTKTNSYQDQRVNYRNRACYGYPPEQHEDGLGQKLFMVDICPL